jgi:4-hydroxy-3-methylbut-2-enyl diphosphate reductase
VEVARQAGCRSHLLQSARDLDPSWLDGAAAVGVTAGASAPEELVQELVDALRSLGATAVDTLQVAEERVQFSLPPELTAR